MQPIRQQAMDARNDDTRTDRKTKERHSIPQNWAKLLTSPTPIRDHERRIDPRTESRYSLVLLGSDGRPVKGETQDIGRSGFACRVREPFGISEQMLCVIRLTHDEPAEGVEKPFLECSVEVVRTTLNKDGFIVGFRIHESKAIGPEVVPAWAGSLTPSLAPLAFETATH